MTDSKQGILSSVRSALGKRSGDPCLEYDRIPREYTAAPSLSGTQVLELFEDRLHDYEAATHRCAPVDLAAAIARCLKVRGISRMLIAEDFPAEWLPTGVRFVRDRQLSYEEIDRADGVMTACSVAVALTGTIILQEGAIGQGRRVLSLLPDYHLCIVDARQIVQTVPEGIRAIAPTALLATTTISGPSATADIEMIRIRGVHGPRVLEVIIVMADAVHEHAD